MRCSLLLVFALAACSRPGPSPEYAAARTKHAAIVAAHPRDAAMQPEMDDVVALLGRVPGTSADAAGARELRERIAAERKALQDEASRRAALVTSAGESPAWPAGTSIGRPPEKPAPIAVGMALDDFVAAHGGCFVRQGAAVIAAADGKERAGESWALKAGDAECAERHAAQKDQVVLVADGAVVALRPASEGRPVTEDRTVRREERRDVELVPLAGGGWGVRGADGRIEPVPAGAEVRTRDGAPMPPPESRR